MALACSPRQPARHCAVHACSMAADLQRRLHQQVLLERFVELPQLALIKASLLLGVGEGRECRAAWAMHTARLHGWLGPRGPLVCERSALIQASFARLLLLLRACARPGCQTANALQARVGCY